MPGHARTAIIDVPVMHLYRCPISHKDLAMSHLHLSPSALYPFDARGIAKRFRHAAIFGALDALQGGETMRFVNDHDPLPLLD